MNIRTGKSQKLTNTQKASIGLSTLLFMISITQPALTTSEGSSSSLLLFFMGGIAILGGGLFEWLVWLANPLYFISIVWLLRKNKCSVQTSILATLIACSFSFWNVILVSESGRTAKIRSLDLGYYLWTASMFVLTIGTVLYFKPIERN